MVENFTLPQQPFALIQDTNVTLGQGQDGISGVFGFGFPRLSGIPRDVTNSSSFVERLAAGGQLEYPLFGVSLSSNGNGTLTLGAVDADVVQDASLIEWHDIVPFPPFGHAANQSIYLHWAIELDKVDVRKSKYWPS